MRNVRNLMLVVFFAITAVPVIAQIASINEQEKADILFLLEEEKMARDVYLVLGEQWDAQIFQNMAASEERHYSIMKALALEAQLNLPKVVIDDVKGKFSNTTLQHLYQDLVDAGSESLPTALQTGAKIEEFGYPGFGESDCEYRAGGYSQSVQRLIDASEKHLQTFTEELSKWE